MGRSLVTGVCQSQASLPDQIKSLHLRTDTELSFIQRMIAPWKIEGSRQAHVKGA